MNVDEGVIIAAKVCQVAGHSTSLYRFDSDGGYIFRLQVGASADRKRKNYYPIVWRLVD